MEYGLIVVVLIVIWLVWSRKSVNKEIKTQFEIIKIDSPIKSNLGIREYIRYCSSNNIECRLVREIAFVELEDKFFCIASRDGYSYLYVPNENNN